MHARYLRIFDMPQTFDALTRPTQELRAVMPSHFNDMCMVKRSLQVPAGKRFDRHDGK